MTALTTGGADAPPAAPRTVTTDLVTYGEALLSFTAVQAGPMHTSRDFVKDVAGSEVNVAVAMRRLGHTSAFVGSLGDDEVGDDVVQTLAAEGVDVRHVRRVPGETGLYLKTRSVLDHVRVSYRRSNSVASEDTPERFEPDVVAGARIVHLTGISSLVSGGCYEVARHLMTTARDRGALVTFDANVRKALLNGRDPRALILPLAERADVLFLSDHEAEFLLGDSQERTLRAARDRLGLRTLVVHGEHQSLALTPDGVQKAATFHRPAVDVVGAGDAFVAGYLSAVTRGWGTADQLALANACGACAVAVRGDVSSMPWEADALSLLSQARLDAR